MINSIDRSFNLNESIINARNLRQRVLVVEKLLSIAETLKVERIESLYNIPTEWLSNFLCNYYQNDISVSIYFSIPNEIIKSLKFESDNRAIERHIKRVLQARYDTYTKIL